MQERELQTLKEWLDILETIPLSYDRHLLLEQIVTLSYKYRHKNINMRQLAMCVSIIHYEEFDDLIIHIPIYINNRIYPPTTFPKLATLLTETGRYKEAIAVCQKCIEWDLNDGTKSDYQGRIERIKKLERKSSLLQDEIIMDCDIHISCMRAELNERLEKIKSERKVPVLNAWYPDLSIKALDTSQYKFYKQWVKNWKKGKLIDIESQVGYIFLYIQSTLLKQISEDTIKELSKLNECYGADKPSDLRSLRYYCTAWASDCYVYLGQYKEAMIVFPNLYINHLISLKIILDEDLSGDDVLRLFGKISLTEYGRNNLLEVSKAIETLLYEYQQHNGTTMIKQWASQVGTQKYRIFNSSSRFQELNITTYQLDDELIKKEYIIQIRNLIREAENRIRTMRGIPHIGEGWISETQLYYEIKQAFPYLDVQHHASPQWLGRQHLDIFIPELLIAIEYQGRQHDEPIDFFGGISAFQNTLKRDAYKRELCHQNNVKLIEVRSNYDIEEIIQQINTRLDP